MPAMKISRRRMVPAALAGAAAGVFPFQRAGAQVTPAIFRFQAEIEPLVALLEDTPREKCAAMLVQQFRKGVSYRQALAALFLAGVRNVNPRPPGFALHTVFVIHSAHLLGLEAPPDVRMFPLFYALDNFKASQERDAKAATGDFTMRELTGKLPSPDRAAAEFTAALDAWDGERAERAIAVLARYRSPAAVTALLLPVAVRDYRNVGHKAIYVANATRTLNTIGWRFAEPVFRSIAVSLADFGPEQQMNGYAFDDQSYRGNVKRAAELLPSLGSEWDSRQADRMVTRAMVETIRTATPAEACDAAAARLRKGATAGSLWDAVHLAAAELRLRANAATGFVAVHAVTTANAVHHNYEAAADPAARVLILLQAVGWMTQFRVFSGAREDGLRSRSILTPAEGEPSPAGEILAEIPGNPDRAFQQALRAGEDPAARSALLSAAARSIAVKADEVHYLKYLVALIEDIPQVSTEWQPHLLATSVYYMKGSKDPVPPATLRAQEALGIVARP